MREVCAHAAIGTHDNVVRYFSAWSEGDRMLVSYFIYPRFCQCISYIIKSFRFNLSFVMENPSLKKLSNVKVVHLVAMLQMGSITKKCRRWFRIVRKVLLIFTAKILPIWTSNLGIFSVKLKMIHASTKLAIWDWSVPILKPFLMTATVDILLEKSSNQFQIKIMICDCRMYFH